MYHYTSTEYAGLILNKGFKPSDIGMGGKGVYLTNIDPCEKLDGATWPTDAFREALLRKNYGDDWNSEQRRRLADAVIVCCVHEDVLKPVEKREGASKVEEVQLENEAVFKVETAIQLYGEVADKGRVSSPGVVVATVVIAVMAVVAIRVAVVARVVAAVAVVAAKHTLTR